MNCKLTTITGQDLSLQPVFEANKTFASSNVYGNSIEYSGARVCNRLHSWNVKRFSAKREKFGKTDSSNHKYIHSKS